MMSAQFKQYVGSLPYQGSEILSTEETFRMLNAYMHVHNYRTSAWDKVNFFLDFRRTEVSMNLENGVFITKLADGRYVKTKDATTKGYHLISCGPVHATYKGVSFSFVDFPDESCSLSTHGLVSKNVRLIPRHLWETYVNNCTAHRLKTCFKRLVRFVRRVEEQVRNQVVESSLVFM